MTRLHWLSLGGVYINGNATLGETKECTAKSDKSTKWTSPFGRHFNSPNVLSRCIFSSQYVLVFVVCTSTSDYFWGCNYECMYVSRRYAKSRDTVVFGYHATLSHFIVLCDRCRSSRVSRLHWARCSRLLCESGKADMCHRSKLTWHNSLWLDGGEIS